MAVTTASVAASHCMKLQRILFLTTIISLFVPTVKTLCWSEMSIRPESVSSYLVLCYNHSLLTQTA
jgi:hypothetical protein